MGDAEVVRRCTDCGKKNEGTEKYLCPECSAFWANTPAGRAKKG